MTETAGSKQDVLGRISLAFNWQNLQREASSSVYKLVIILFSGEFCTLLLWSCGVHVQTGIGRNVLPEDGNSTFLQNVGT
jgi:hypothetical protein